MKMITARAETSPMSGLPLGLEGLLVPRAQPVVEEGEEEGYDDQRETVDDGEVQAGDHHGAHGGGPGDVDYDEDHVQRGVEGQHLQAKAPLVRSRLVHAVYSCRLVEHAHPPPIHDGRERPSAHLRPYRLQKRPRYCGFWRPSMSSAGPLRAREPIACRDLLPI